jgi:hypothetical protein
VHALWGRLYGLKRLVGVLVTAADQQGKYRTDYAHDAGDLEDLAKL